MLNKLLLLNIGLFFIPSIYAAELNSGDTSWILTSTALVLFMTLPGLALFYGGLVRSKNVLSVLMQCFAIACLISVCWVVYGYSLAFKGDGLFIGNLSAAFLNGVGRDSLVGGVPETVFISFQMTFAIITPALVVGAFAERMKFGAMCIFSVVWFTLVYLPACHMVWGGGYLANLGVIDFAGGLVVHATCGIGALVIALYLGQRNGFMKTPMPPHNRTMVMIGASMLWVGWFGFNGGSVLSADPGLTSLTLVTTCLAAAAGGVVAALVSFLKFKNLDLTMFLNGILGGLVGITAGADQMSPTDAIVIGVVAGAIIVFAVSLIDRLKLDDPVGAIAVHLVCGVWGTLAVGIFGNLASKAQFISQLTGVVSYAIICIISSFAIIYTLKKIVGIRVSEREELEGLDAHEHGMDAYPDFRLNEH